MKKLLIIPLLLLAGLVFGQSSTQIRSLNGFYTNGLPGLRIEDTLKPLNVQSTYLLTPCDTCLGYDSSKVVTDVTLNITADSIYVYKGGAFVRAIKLGTSSGGTVTGGSISWPGTIYSTPTTATLSGGTLTFSPLLASQSAYTIYGRGSGSGTPSFLSSLDSNWIPSLHTQAYYDARYAAIGSSGGGSSSGWGLTGNTVGNSTSFIGTLDGYSLWFAAAGVRSAYIDSISREMVVGVTTGYKTRIYPRTGLGASAGATNPIMALELAPATKTYFYSTNGTLLNYSGAFAVDGTFSATTVNGVNADFFSTNGTNGTGTVKLPNNVQVGGSGYIYSTNGSTYGMKFNIWSGSAYVDRLWFFQSGRIGNSSTDDGVNALQITGNVKAGQFRISALHTAPASATDTGTLGEIRWTSTAVYLCIATNTWVKATLATF